VQYTDDGFACQIAEALDGSLVPDAKGNYSCHCPSHRDRNPSLAVRDSTDGKVLVYCFAGCRQADVLAALRRLGLLPGKPKPTAQTTAPAQPPRPARPAPDPFKMWREASPLVTGSLVETYLRNRGLEIPAGASPLRAFPLALADPEPSSGDGCVDRAVRRDRDHLACDLPLARRTQGVGRAGPLVPGWR
jgi:putative DNA primase/helicase